MFILIVLIIVVVIVAVSIHNKNPEVIAKKEEEAKERREAYVNAYKQISESSVADSIAQSLIDQFSDRSGYLISYLRTEKATIWLRVYYDGIVLEKHNDKQKIDDTIEDRVIALTRFSDHDIENLDSLLLTAFRNYLFKKLEALDHLNVRKVDSSYGETFAVITYTPTKTTWTVMPT